jgi:hypothetical protein
MAKQIRVKREFSLDDLRAADKRAKLRSPLAVSGIFG